GRDKRDAERQKLSARVTSAITNRDWAARVSSAAVFHWRRQLRDSSRREAVASSELVTIWRTSRGSRFKPSLSLLAKLRALVQEWNSPNCCSTTGPGCSSTARQTTARSPQN